MNTNLGELNVILDQFLEEVGGIEEAPGADDIASLEIDDIVQLEDGTELTVVDKDDEFVYLEDADGKEFSLEIDSEDEPETTNEE